MAAASIGLVVWAGWGVVVDHHARCQFVALDVGQGDATLIRTADGQDVLIDGGPNTSVVQGLERHLPLGDQDLELVIETHPDSDHIAGLPAVLEKYQVKTILMSGVKSGTQVDQQWQAAVSAEQARVVIARAGESLTIGHDLTLSVLWPTAAWLASPASAADGTNGTSVVVRGVCGGSAFIVSGDAPIDVEQRILDLNPGLSASLLKLGHHGSKYSTSDQWLRTIKPRMAVISDGRKNRYGHPNPSVLERLKLFQIPVARTDERGDVRLVSDGRGGWR